MIAKTFFYYEYESRLKPGHIVAAIIIRGNERHFYAARATAQEARDSAWAQYIAARRQEVWDINQRNSRRLNAQHIYTPRRNEDNICAGCRQDNALHPDTMPPGEDCQMSKGEHGLDPEDYRLEQREQLWVEYEDDHCDDRHDSQI